MDNFDLFGEIVISDPLLRDIFSEQPLTVLDTKSGPWQARKKQWLAKGIKSEVGRDADLTFSGAAGKFDFYRVKEGKKKTTEEQGTSIFDPALCELMYRWYCPEGGSILDPFAGGSVRGIVANYLGFKYTGIELRPEQVESNRQQGLDILPVNNQPQWYCGDSEAVLSGEWTQLFDFIFSCPPYADLEVYSDLAEDLSNMPYDVFLEKYFSIIEKSLLLLKPGAFACFVVGDIRDKRGFYRDFISHTKQAFIRAGALLYDEAVLLNVVGSASMRADKTFGANKKLVKIHQNVLIFKKL